MTDTGHQGPDPRFALNNTQGEIDFAYRTVHETAVGAFETALSVSQVVRYAGSGSIDSAESFACVAE